MVELCNTQKFKSAKLRATFNTICSTLAESDYLQSAQVTRSVL